MVRVVFLALATLACALSSSVADDELMAEFNKATTEILAELQPEPAPIHRAEEEASTESEREELAAAEPAPITEMLLDEKEHKAAVKASYQSNVKTIYYHLEEIIKKILAHKVKWTKKYNGDLMKIAKEVLKHKKAAKKKMKKFTKAKGKADAAKALAKSMKKALVKAKAKLKQKMKDAMKSQKVLKGLYVKGLKNKAGEVCMIRKIQCMVAKFNGEKKLKKKYCGACKETPALVKKWTKAATAIYATATITWGDDKTKKWWIKNVCPKGASISKRLYRCATTGNKCKEYIEFENMKQALGAKNAMKNKYFKGAIKKLKKSGGSMSNIKFINFAQFHARDGTCTKVLPG